MNWSDEIDIMQLPLNYVWRKKIFDDIQDNVDCDKLNTKLSNINNKKNIFPYPDLVFNAFNLVNYNDIRVVFIGQDPYHGKLNNIPQATGMSFSVPKEFPIPSSLKNIFNNAMKYNHFHKYPEHGNLEFWASQGCLLLNTSLTVEYKKPNVHSNIWKDFTNYIIKKISDKKSNLVFVLWGKHAYSKLELIDTNKHSVVISSHPSGYSHNNSMLGYPPFSSIDQFGTINKLLKDNNKREIIWQI